jgi:steroid 5-alpha reductase family enzyme
LGWTLSLRNNNVTVVDSLWGMFFLIVTVLSFYLFALPSWRSLLLLVLVILWSCRLSFYLHVRNHNKAEDLRYQAIRQRNEPNFRIKSVYLIFMFQAVLAWVIALPLFVAMQSLNPLNLIDVLAVFLWVIGMSFQVIGDAQLARFKSKPENKGKVLNTGLWRYTRHPNYFGESCIWLGYGLLATAAGYAWALLPALFMIYLLVKVTGAALLEQDIAQRRPAYQHYTKTTNGFIPWFPKNDE